LLSATEMHTFLFISYSFVVIYWIVTVVHLQSGKL